MLTWKNEIYQSILYFIQILVQQAENIGENIKREKFSKSFKFSLIGKILSLSPKQFLN